MHRFVTLFNSRKCSNRNILFFYFHIEIVPLKRDESMKLIIQPSHGTLELNNN
jgi:hypothetical protein